MKTLSLLLYLVLSVVLLYGAVCPIVLAKSRKPPKSHLYPPVILTVRFT